MNVFASPIVAGRKRDREREGVPFYNYWDMLCASAQRFLNGILFAGWKEERGWGGKRKEESCPLVESKINSKILKASLYTLKVSIAGLLDLACLKGFLQMSLHKQAVGSPDFLLFSKRPVFYIPVWKFLNGMLILNANLLKHQNYYILGKEADTKNSM
jgi:hypothetical protein